MPKDPPQELDALLQEARELLGDDAPEFVRLLGRVFEITSTDAFKQCDCIIDEDKEDFNG